MGSGCVLGDGPFFGLEWKRERVGVEVGVGGGGGGVGLGGGIRRHTSGRYREPLMLTFWPCEWLYALQEPILVCLFFVLFPPLLVILFEALLVALFLFLLSCLGFFLRLSCPSCYLVLVLCSSSCYLVLGSSCFLLLCSSSCYLVLDSA